jgi:hypothetical protein
VRDRLVGVRSLVLEFHGMLKSLANHPELSHVFHFELS